jgi:ATP:cob(I)alamin adenosyltransferase
MSITTKTGDNGKTSLLCGKRVFKDDIRIELCGTLDELCSYLGTAKSLIKGGKLKMSLEDIQRDLFVVGAEIAATPQYLNKLKKRVNNIYISKLEGLIAQWEAKKKFNANCFYLCGENPASSFFDLSRTTARKAERLAVTLKRKKILKNPDIIIYLNRLSDLLYLFVRAAEKKPKRK